MVIRNIAPLILVIVIGLTACAAPPPLPETPTSSAPTALPTPTPRAPEVFDAGPREGAMGSVELNANGTPFRYTVVEGDLAFTVCVRFNLAAEQLTFDDTGASAYGEIRPGDVLRFVLYEPDQRP